MFADRSRLQQTLRKPVAVAIAAKRAMSWYLTDVILSECGPETTDVFGSGLLCSRAATPYWAKDPKIAYRTINARAETVDKAPSFRRAFAKRRCLIPADGFYEWRKTAKPKLPFAIAMKDGRPFIFAPALEKTGKIPNLGSGCALARLSQASLMSS
jgi:hypothetical protein